MPEYEHEHLTRLGEGHKNQPKSPQITLLCDTERPFREGKPLEATSAKMFLLLKSLNDGDSCYFKKSSLIMWHPNHCIL